ncbi:MAG: glucose 1-dehydrogenase [Chloroflexi bacterium]|nr:glucose 1-dehydrogenase [Chloroflexota bacterium]
MARVKAFVVTPGHPGSGRLVDVPQSALLPGQALVQVISVGLDGTDRELLQGKYGEAPSGDDYLIIGHESLGRVVAAPPGTVPEDGLVVAIVRRPDPAPCRNCAAGEWDMCLNGRYTERGIKGAHGFLAERYVEEPQYLVSLPKDLAGVGVLLEPLSIVEKALDQIRRIQGRLVWEPRRALVLGAGTIGTFAASLLRLEGLEVYLYSKGDGGRGRQVAEQTGARFISADERRLDHAIAAETGPIDIAVEATGYSPLAFEATDLVGPNGVVCLTGVSAGSRDLVIDSSHLNLEMVLENKLVFGTVNANRRHFEKGVLDLQAIDRRWPGLLGQMITRRVPLGQLSPAELERPDDLKAVVDIGLA